MSSEHEEICFEHSNKEMLLLRENFRQLIVKGMHVGKDMKMILLGKFEDNHGHSHSHGGEEPPDQQEFITAQQLLADNNPYESHGDDVLSSGHKFTSNQNIIEPFEKMGKSKPKKKKVVKKSSRRNKVLHEETKESENWGDESHGFGTNKRGDMDIEMRQK